MKRFDQFDPKKLKELFENNRSMAGLLFFTLLLGVIYVAGRQEDRKVVYYNQEQPNFSRGRVLSSGSSIYQKKDKIYSERMDSLAEKIEALSKKIEEKNKELEEIKTVREKEVKETTPPEKKPEVTFEEPKVNHQTSVVSDGKATAVMTTESRRSDSRRAKKRSGPAIITFPVKTKESREGVSVKLPSGSFVKAKLLTGVEAPEGKALPILLQADYAFIGPNKSRVDLSGCFLIAKSTGNMSIERVEMQTTKISCVARSGKSFERPIKGFVADDSDNSFAVIGSVNSKQDRVAAMAFLSSVVNGISEAVAKTQTTQEVGDGGTSTNITGDQGKYIAANGAGSAATTITQWYLKHAEKLLPTINIGSGHDVWIIVQDSVDLPNWYFKSVSNHKGNFDFLSNIIE